MTGTVDYLEVMSTLGSIMAKHGQGTKLAMETASLWSDRSGSAKAAWDKYQEAAKQSTGKLDTAGILMQLAAMNPNFAKALTQTLRMWDGRIPELIQIIEEFQAASEQAMKT